MDIDLYSKACDLWDNFIEEVLYNNRFIVKHEVLDYIRKFAEENKKTIEKDSILYRARIFNDDSSFVYYLKNGINGLEGEFSSELYRSMKQVEINQKNETGFWGYNVQNSFVPSTNESIGDGRLNPALIKYLYVAENPYTAMVEVRPYLESKVSIAEIRVNENIEIADFTFENIAKYDGFEKYLLILIIVDFSKPIDFNKKKYIPTQYVAEYIKNLGFEGIRFNSSLHKSGRNLTIFNYSKCTPISSKLYEVKDICFEANCLAPLDGDELIDEKLKAFKIDELSFLKKPLLRQS